MKKKLFTFLCILAMPMILAAGATLRIKNYGQLVLLPFRQEYFEVPLGAIFEFEKGDIKKSSVEFVTFIYF